MCTANFMLEYLARREQLMEDIQSIVDGQLEDVIVDDIREELIEKLCDAVCKNFHIQHLTVL